MSEVPSEKSTNVRAQPGLRGVSFVLRALDRLAPPLAGAAAEAIFRAPRRFPVPAREHEWLSTAEVLRIPSDGESLPAWSWGHGPAVLLAHGWEGRGGQMGALAQGLAAAGLRAVAFDGPAHGGSRRRLSSLPQMAGSLAAAASAVGPFHAVVGHSFGAAAACWAVAQGLAVERLVLLAPPADLHGYIAGFGQLLGVRQATVERMVRRIEARFGIEWQQARRPAIAGARCAPDTPVLVVHDEGDEETPWRDGETVAATWPRGELVRTRGLGHRRLLRDPMVVAAVAAYCSPHQLRAAG